MKLLIFGATGMVGQALVNEALAQGHVVTAVARDAAQLTPRTGVTVCVGDALDSAQVAHLAKDHDAVIASISGRKSGHDTIPKAAQVLLHTLPTVGVTRLLWVGGAGSLEVAPGVRLVDTPQFPEMYKAEALGQSEALYVFRLQGNEMNWTFYSPAALLEPTDAKRSYRLGGDAFFTDDEGHSRIGVADFAKALIDGLDVCKNEGLGLRRRVSVAY